MPDETEENHYRGRRHQNDEKQALSAVEILKLPPRLRGRAELFERGPAFACEAVLKSDFSNRHRFIAPLAVRSSASIMPPVVSRIGTAWRCAVKNPTIREGARQGPATRRDERSGGNGDWSRGHPPAPSPTSTHGAHRRPSHRPRSRE